MMLATAYSYVNLFERLRNQYCCCGHCATRVSNRWRDLQDVEKRLLAASYRARERRDFRRARAYALQAAAVRQEADACDLLACAKTGSSSLLTQLVTAVVGLVSFNRTNHCTRMPEKWSKQFAPM